MLNNEAVLTQKKYNINHKSKTSILTLFRMGGGGAY